MHKIWEQRWLILSLLVAIIAGRMLLSTHHFYVHDDIQVFRLNEFVECLKTGQIPCRWSSELGKGYGYPWFNFYPPMIYLISSGFHLLGFSLITSLNLLAFASMILAAWGMYLLVKELTENPPIAFFGSLLLTLYPFHATNIFLRGVYAENLAWSLTPWLLLYLTRQLKSQKTQTIIPFLFALLYLTHIISSFIVTGLSILFVAVLHFLYQTGLRPLKKIAWQLGLAVAMAAFFLVPALAEKGMVQSESLTAGYYSYLNHFVSLKQLFLDYTWNYGASYWAQPSEEMGYMVGHLHTILLGLSLMLGLYFARRHRLFHLSLIMSLAFIFLILLTHSKGIPIYQIIPSLSYVQFPWRFIGWAGIPLTLAITLSLSVLPKKIWLTIVSLATIALSIYSYPFFFPRAYDDYRDADFISGQFRQEQQTKALFDYLPRTVPQVNDDFREGSSTASNTFYYPGWVGKIDGREVAITASELDGTIVPVDQSLDRTKLEITWQETPFRLAMDLISLLTLSIYSLYLYQSHVQ